MPVSLARKHSKAQPRKFGMAGDSELGICPAGNTQLRPVITTILERAGTISCWQSTAHRQALAPDLIETAFQARSIIDIAISSNSVLLAPSQESFDLLGVSFRRKGLIPQR